MEKVQSWGTGNSTSNPSFPLDWSKLAVSLGLNILIFGMGCQQWPCILPSIVGSIRGRKEEIDAKQLRRAKFRVQSQGLDAPT